MFLSDFIEHVSLLFQHINLIALKNRIEPDFETNLRVLYRRFSITFHIPLNEVEKLNLGYILLHLKEHDLFSVSDDEVKKIKHNLLKKITTNQEKEDDAWIEEQTLIGLKQEQEMLKNPQKKQDGAPPNIEMKF